MKASPLLLPLLLLVATATAAEAQHSYAGPFGSSPNPWRFAVWTGGLPPDGGSSTLTVAFPNPDGPLNYTASFDRGAFLFNTLTFASAGGTVTLQPDSLTTGNRLVAAGVNPRIVQNGLGTGFFQNAGPDTYTFGGATIIGTGLGQVQFAGGLAGPGGITVDYAQALPTSGRVIFAAPSANPHTFTGQVTLTAGNVTLGGTAAPFGSAANAVIVNGGTLGVQSAAAAVIVPNAVTLNANLVYTGAADTDAGRNLTVTGVLADGGTGPRGVEVRTVNGISGAGGTLILQGANTFTGDTTVAYSHHYQSTAPAAGTLTLSGAAGAATGSPRFTIADGGTLLLDSAAVNHGTNNRIGNAAEVVLAGGQFRINGAANAATGESVGALSVGGGSIVAVDSGAANNAGTAVQFDSLSRPGRGAVLFRGSNASFGTAPGTGVGNVTFTTAPTAQLVGGNGPGTPDVSILPYAYAATVLTGNAANGTELATYGAAGIRPLTAAEYATTLPAGATTQNVKLVTASTVFNGTATVNALVLGGTLSFTSGSAGVITVGSGTVLSTASVTVRSSVGLEFGSKEAHIITGGSSSTTLTLAGVVSSTNGLTKSGTGVLRLTNTANALAGAAGLTINDGTVEIASPAVLGSLGSVTVNGKAAGQSPGLEYTGSTAATFALPVTVDGGLMRFAASGTGVLTLAGAIQGSGGIVIDTAGDVRLGSTSNTYAGSTRVHAGRLLLGGDANLGPNTPSVVLASGGLRLEGDWTTAKMLRITDMGTLDTNGFNAVLNGPLVGGGTLLKSSAGRLTLTRPSDFGQAFVNSTVTVNAGELRVTNADGSATGLAGLVTVRTGATLSGTGRIGGSLNLEAGSVLKPGSDGVGTLFTNSNVAIFGTYSADISGATSDRIALTGQLQIDNAATLELLGTPTPGVTYTLAEYTQLSTSQMFGTITGLPGTHALVIGTTSMRLVPVPEPACLLAVAGLLAVAARRRRWL